MISDTPIAPLLVTVFTSILEVFLLCLAGYVLAGRGVLDRKTQKQLNRLNVSLFTPSLLFSKVAFFLSPAKLRELWVIPLFFVLVTAVSMAVSFTLGLIFRLKRSQRSFGMAAAMFMNSNSLPIALMQSLVVTVPGLKWGKNDNKDAMVGRALTYLVLYSTLGMILRWSYGVRLLSQADPEPVTKMTNPDEDHETSALLPPDETAFPASNAEQCILNHPHSEGSTQVGTDDEPDPNFLPHIVISDTDREHIQGHLQRRPQHITALHTHSSFFHSFPNSPAPSRPDTPDTQKPVAAFTSSPTSSDDEEDYSSSDDGDIESTRLPRHRPATAPTSTRFQSLMRRTGHRIGGAWTTLNEFMTVPLWAALASIIVACVRPMQHALDVHMQPVKGALTAAGNCSIPLTLIVLGAYFYTPPAPERELDTSRPRGLRAAVSSASLYSMVHSVRELFKLRPRDTAARRRMSGDESLMAASAGSGRPGETTTVIIAVVSRMIITPLLLLPLMALSARFDIQAVFEDPVFVVANVLLISSPPALTLAQITQAASGDAFERLISRTIFWSYCVITPPATIIYVVIGLILAKL
ncbi:hypothetical protein PLICRDRAFT_125029 [Plicaturopsis crispa FD-325 SS-3]|nr:hypothetical protein PLICRDRAFT_125029 [Plicaturopsis crispa FD-325 SS-3]